MSNAIFSKRSKNRGGLTLIRKYANQCQNHQDHIDKDDTLFFDSRES